MAKIERPILFSAPMVRAILDGMKTMTRRVIIPQPKSVGFGENCSVAPYCTGTEWPLAYYERRGSCWNSSPPLQCPYGRIGDDLWVRETFYNDLIGGKDPSHIYYRADGTCCEMIPECQCADVGKSKWTPSIYMPRWASRLTLEVTAVRVQRLQQISEEDALAEGIDREDLKLCHVTPENCFKKLWNSINGKRKGCSWEANPFVWVVEFSPHLRSSSSAVKTP